MMTNKKRNASFPLAALLLVAAVVLVALFSLQPVEQEKTQSSANLAVAQQFQTELENQFTNMVSGNTSEGKVYQISPTAQAAPVPDPARYGEAESPAELEWLIKEAESILDGQELFFSTETQIMKGTTIHYYLDDTILAITWKQPFENAAFTFSEVKVLHPSQFRRHLSGGEFNSGTLSKTTEMSQSVNAVVACNGDFYSYRRQGMVVTNGTVHKFVRGVKDLCFIDENGDLILERGLTFENVEEAQAYVDEHNINFSIAFGPILVQDGENVCPNGYGLGEIMTGYPRAALCQMDKLHYLFAVSNMESPHYNNLIMREFAKVIHSTGCQKAYAVDGGQTATVVMNNQLINRVNYGSERLISDIIYFATAKPMGE